MRVLLTVQGEGRGHLTQALAFQQWCRREGHEVVAVLAGANRNRRWPDYFERGFDVPVERLASPAMIYSNSRRFSTAATLWTLLTRLGDYRGSVRCLEAAIRQTQPDLLVNFLEPVAAWHRAISGGRVPILSVGHQFLVNRPGSVRLGVQRMQQWAFRQYVDFVGAGTTRYALSFYRAEEDPGQGFLIGPPLLREELFQVCPTWGRHLLVYLLNDGYLREVEAWHRRHPEVELHCFCQRPGRPEEERRDTHLVIYQLHATRFLESMAQCRAVVCTAGFESLSEAAWLGKPVLAIPVEGHIEQALNAADAERCGLGVASREFSLDRVLSLTRPRAAQQSFRVWMKESDSRLSRAVGLAVRSGRRPYSAGPEPDELTLRPAGSGACRRRVWVPPGPHAGSPGGVVPKTVTSRAWTSGEAGSR